MKLNKIWYYFNSFLKIFDLLDNKLALIIFIINKNIIFSFKNKYLFKISSWLDLLIIKETIIDDYYRINNVSKPQIIVDVGAGFGEFSILSAKIFPQARIIAFEPNPQLAKLMKENILLNGVNNILLQQKAVSNEKNVKLNIAVEGTQSSLFLNKNKVKTIKAIGYNLKTIFKDEKISFLKIDCEGGEWDIIRNLKKSDLQKIKIISIEYHRHYVKEVDLLIKKKLTANGFKCYARPDEFDENMGHLIAFFKT